MRKSILSLALTTCLATNAQAADRIAITPSGQPEAIFRNANLADVDGKVANTCMDLGWTISNQSLNQITCEVPMNMMRSVLTQMLIGNSYSTPPKALISVSLAQVGADVRAQARAWAETQMAFGQMRQQPYTDDNTFNNLIGFLFKAGGAWPNGTSFTGTFVGFDYDKATANSGLTVTKIFRNQPAQIAGMQLGDRIVSVNGKTFKSVEEFTKRLNSIKAGATYPVIVQRNGQSITLNMVQKTRPTVGSPEWIAGKAEQAESEPPKNP